MTHPRSCNVKSNFYPRSPCGERRPHGPPRGGDYLISIHALLAESDDVVHQTVELRSVISIHALLAESDILGRGEVV